MMLVAQLALPGYVQGIHHPDILLYLYESIVSISGVTHSSLATLPDHVPVTPLCVLVETGGEWKMMDLRLELPPEFRLCFLEKTRM